MKNKKKRRWPDYEPIDLDKATGEKVVTFGTALFMRNDSRALRIVFPTGQIFTFQPIDELPTVKKEV